MSLREVQCGDCGVMTSTSLLSTLSSSSPSTHSQTAMRVSSLLLKKYKIAVVGAAGNVGSEVCVQALAAGHSVVGLDRPSKGKVQEHPKYSYQALDSTDYAAYKEAVAGCDALIHLAAVYIAEDAKGKDVNGNTLPNAVVHNKNVSMSYNALCVAQELGIKRVSIASSINSIGAVFSQHPKYDYVPLDEKHPFRPEDPYSVSKYIAEIQCDSMVRVDPSMRIASLRFHWVVPKAETNKTDLDKAQGHWKDLWGWVSLKATAESCLLGLTAPESSFPSGTHETFYIVAPTICGQRSSAELLKEHYPEIEVRGQLQGNQGLFDCSKAERMLGWKEGESFAWKG